MSEQNTCQCGHLEGAHLGELCGECWASMDARGTSWCCSKFRLPFNVPSDVQTPFDDYHKGYEDGYAQGRKDGYELRQMKVNGILQGMKL